VPSDLKPKNLFFCRSCSRDCVVANTSRS